MDSDSPASLDMISGPLIRKKKAPVSLATAFAMRVLPDLWLVGGGVVFDARSFFRSGFFFPVEVEKKILSQNTGRPVEEDALGRLDADRLEELRVAQGELDQLPDLGLL